jgi:two-component system cell cycle response regulator
MGARILVVEDNQANMDLMNYLLTAFGHQVLCAYDGEAGVAMARSERPDIILCDLQLPKLDGHGVLAALRADPATRDIPILAASAAAVSDGGAALRREGFTGLLPKSLEPDVLLPSLDTFLPPALRSSFGGASPAAGDNPAAAPNAHVLVLDPSAMGDGMAAAVLLHHGFRVEVAADTEAVSALGKAVFDLIVVDGPASSSFIGATLIKFSATPVIRTVPADPAELVRAVNLALLQG